MAPIVNTGLVFVLFLLRNKTMTQSTNLFTTHPGIMTSIILLKFALSMSSFIYGQRT